MATLPDIAPQALGGKETPSPRPSLKTVGRTPSVLPAWLRAQSINVSRHAASLRPFRREEFGTGAAAPSEGHIQVVNDLITRLRRGLLKMSKNVAIATGTASE